jgi:uncharacterized protein YkwD
MKKLFNKIWRFIKAMLPNSWFPTEEVIYALEDNMTDWKLIEVLIFRELNNYRIENNLKPVKTEVHTKAESDIRTKYMVEVEHMSHDYFSVSSRRLKDMGFKSVGENVAYGYTTAENVMTAWKNSPGHNKLLLTSRFEYVGISKLRGLRSVYYCMMLSR